MNIVPFGGIENPDRTISWPPDHHTVFDCFGAREAFEAGIPVQLPNNVTLRVASIPALTLLKITAWKDRKHSHPGRDIANLLDKPSIESILSILLPQADTSGPLLLAQQSGLDLEHPRRLIEALCGGLTDNL